MKEYRLNEKQPEECEGKVQLRKFHGKYVVCRTGFPNRYWTGNGWYFGGFAMRYKTQREARAVLLSIVMTGRQDEVMWVPPPFTMNVGGAR
jgi:hypothetical protein